MNLILLKTYLAIVDNGSLIKASKALNVTQSTVTTRLQMLEDDVGQTLINRQKSGITLTAAGDTFKRYALALSNMWQQALLDTSLPDGMDSICHLGCEANLWHRLGRTLAQTVRAQYPTTALSIRLADHAQIEQWLNSGLINAAICYQPSVLDGVNTQKIGTEKLQLFSTQKNGSTTNDPHYVYVESGEYFGKEHATAFTNAGVAKHSFTCASWALDHILDCGGSAYLPSHIAETHQTKGDIFHLKTAPEFERPYYFISEKIAERAWPWLAGVLRTL